MQLNVEDVAVSEIGVPFLRNVKTYGTGLNKNLLFSLQLSLFQDNKLDGDQSLSATPKGTVSKKGKTSRDMPPLLIAQPPAVLEGDCAVSVFPYISPSSESSKKCLCAPTLYFSFMFSFFYFRVHSLCFF